MVNDVSPKYLQIINYFVNKMKNGELKDNEKLPTEEEICRLFNVSRTTARQALNGLANEGYIYKSQGKGSFVNLSKMKMQLNSLQGYSEEMKNKGLTPRSKLISVNICNPDAMIAEKLGIDVTIKIYSICRIRYADDVALSLENAFLPFFICPDIERHDLTGSLYKILKDHYNITPVRANECIEASFIDRNTAKLLSVKTGTQALIIERTTYLADDTPFEYVRSIYRGDKYKFTVDLFRKTL